GLEHVGDAHVRLGGLVGLVEAEDGLVSRGRDLRGSRSGGARSPVSRDLRNVLGLHVATGRRRPVVVPAHLEAIEIGAVCGHFEGPALEGLRAGGSAGAAAGAAGPGRARRSGGSTISGRTSVATASTARSISA